MERESVKLKVVKHLYRKILNELVRIYARYFEHHDGKEWDCDNNYSKLMMGNWERARLGGPGHS
jgi:hypothetical protein